MGKLWFQGHLSDAGSNCRVYEGDGSRNRLVATFERADDAADVVRRHNAGLDEAAPFQVGDKVIVGLGQVGLCVVEQCFMAAGGWGVLAKGRWSRSNVHGLYDLPASDVVKAPSVPGPPDGPRIPPRAVA